MTDTSENNMEKIFHRRRAFYMEEYKKDILMENREIEAIVREVVRKAVEGGNLGVGNDAAASGRAPGTGDVAAASGRAFGTGDTATASGRTLGTGDIAAASDRVPGTGDIATANGSFPGTGNLTAANGGLVPVTMPLALAVKLIEGIEAKAAEWGMRVVTAVSDAAARPVAIHCMDGAYIGSFDVALNKTYTSIAFQMSTAQLGTLSGPGESLYGIQFTNEGRIVIFGGGEVLKRGDVIVGALGVSGGSAEQDTALAAYGKSLFENI